jgi:hypothetical protein
MAQWLFLPMTRDDKLADKLMPSLVDRVFDFCDLEDAAANPNILVHMIYGHYFSATRAKLFGIGIVKDGVMVGHFLVQLEDFYGTANMTVLQYSLDESPPREFRDQVLWDLRDLARKCGAQNLCGVCPDEKVERLHRVFHGMKKFATIMTYDLTENLNGQKRADDRNARSTA